MNPQDTNIGSETVKTWRSRDVPGVHVLMFDNHLPEGNYVAWHDQYCITAATRLQAPTTFHYRGRVFPVIEQSVVVLSPGELYRAAPREDPGSGFAILVDASRLHGPDSGGKDLEVCIRNSFAFSAFARFMASLGPWGTPLDHGSLFQLAIQTLRPSPAHELAPKCPGGLHRARELIHDCSDDRDLTIESLATVAGLSREHFARSFHDRYGMPPHRYRMHVRLGRARRLLASGASATEVAFACGFADQSHLNRWFKKVVGVTPGVYARAAG